ncbi:hypothetical protein TRICI_000713 [Trichomonascus ciferrii]|uniref:Xylanolytic transcriptional activator regulatory domain-containing protein n=1 Tax=Trichomonascus ciferrii TaxID=44093 RepID=A0A642VC11_9ASCO|nr:hypothetical protein TRICI_000713 [Trichomonascus ciferrii]
MKCDIVTHGIPCSRCEARGNVKCEMFPTKRRYGPDVPIPVPRSPNCQRNNDQGSGKQSAEDKLSLSIIRNDTTSNFNNVQTTSSFPESISRLEPVDEDGIDKENLDGYMLDNIPDIGSPFFNSLNRAFTPAPNNNIPAGGSARSPGSTRSPAMLLSLSRDDQGRETLEFVIDKAKQGSVISKDTLTFLGESSPLSMLLRGFHDSGHVPMNSVARRKPDTPSTHSDVSYADSVVSSLQPGILEDFLSSYFTKVHPFYPIINRRWFADRYAANNIPLLLLSSVCFAACYHCEQDTILRAGFTTRANAKETFYREAKKVFDDEQEDDVVVILQAAVLLSFYGGKPRQVWNNRSWLAIAVTVAEDMGIHRSMLRSQMNETDKSHLRIIWWCMVIRDIMTSLTLGRPQKICDLRCDVDLLTLKDFEIDEDPENPIFGKKDPTMHHFLVEYAKANVLMMKIFSARYDPRSDLQPNMTDHHKELIDWRQNLPDCLDWKTNPSSFAAMYTSMVYHHLVIFIFRPRMVDSEIMELCSLEQAVKSSTEIASLVAKLGVRDTLVVPQDMYSIFVTAMVVLISDTKTNKSVVSKLQLQICMMTLKQAAESWDHASWLVRMFDRVLESEPDSSGVQTPAGEPNVRTDDMELLRGLFGSIE